MRPLASSLLFAALLLLVGNAMAREAYRFDGEFQDPDTGWHDRISQPSGICIAGNDAYVAMQGGNCIQKYTTAGAYVSFYGSGSAGDGNNELNGPIGIEVVGDTLWIADTSNQRIMKRALDFAYLGQFGVPGTGKGQFDYPFGLCVQPGTARVLVADAGNNRLSVWNLDGVFTRHMTPAGGYALSHPQDVDCDAEGNLYVCDTYNNRVVKLNASGTRITKFTGFLAPSAVTVVGSALYVTDSGLHRIVKLDLAGHRLATIGTSTYGPAYLEYPYDADVDEQGRVFVADWGAHRIQRFRLNAAPTPPTELKISPSSPTTGSQLVAKASGGADPDGDPLTYKYLWYSSPDNKTYTSRWGTRILRPEFTSPGQYWKVKSQVFDGDAYSTWKTSQPVRIRPAATLLALTASAQAVNGLIDLRLDLLNECVISGQLCNLAGRIVALFPEHRAPQGPSQLTFAVRSTSGLTLPAGQYLLNLRLTSPGGGQASQVLPLSLQ